jgi:hypothetical protein
MKRQGFPQVNVLMFSMFPERPERPDESESMPPGTSADYGFVAVVRNNWAGHQCSLPDSSGPLPTASLRDSRNKKGTANRPLSFLHTYWQ